MRAQGLFVRALAWRERESAVGMRFVFLECRPRAANRMHLSINPKIFSERLVAWIKNYMIRELGE